MKERFQKEVDKVIEDFNFEKVHETMVKLNWKWYHAGEGTKLPEFYTIKSRGIKLLQEAAENAVAKKGEWINASGGFRAEAKYYKKKEGLREKSELWVRLAFVLEEWDNCV